MLWLIARKELKEIFRQGVFKIAVLTILGLLSVSLIISLSYNQFLNKLLKESQELAREQWDNQGDKNQHSAAHYGIYLLKPKSSLALWDNGVDKYTGTTVYIEAHKRNNSLFKAVQDSPMLAKWGELTPSFVMLFLLPLLILWMTFNIISGEKEQGTYRLIRSQGVSSLKWLQGKALAVWIVAVLLIAPAFLVSGILLGGAGFWSLEGLLLLFVYLLYAGIFIHVGIAVSAFISKSSVSIICLIGFWILSNWVIPKITANITQSLYPPPLESVFKKQIQDEIVKNGILRHDPNNKNTIAFKKYTLKKYGVDSIYKLPFNYNGYILQAAEDTNNLIFDKHYSDLYELYKKQLRIHTISGVLSPFSLTRQLSMGLCKTDIWAHIHFTEATDKYRKLFIKTLNKDLIASSYDPAKRFIRPKKFWKEMPEFKYRLPGLKLFWQHYRIILMVFLLWFIASLGMLLLASKKLNLEK
ncbi:hypothetical protein MNBD_BACTEROID01-1664 [hydrothermal vent metagenome]|uniref:DUF3526 domain-containing protein n=1 Tax=hydrothermal vent metagenome TaxID=652676 RepID=A0A3B0UH72_9ZZZZ